MSGVLNNCMQFLGGIIVGIIFGLFHVVYNYCSCNAIINWIKFIEFTSLVILVPIICHVYHLDEAKYIFIVTFGYVCKRVWYPKKESPEKTKDSSSKYKIDDD